MKRWRLLLALMFTVLVLDQATKFWAVGSLTRVFERHGARTFGQKLELFLGRENLEGMRKKPIVVHPDHFRFKYVENPGAAWGVLGATPERVRVPFFYMMSLLAIGFIVHFSRRLSERQRTLRFAMGLVLGGALGNFVDRLVRGYVIDFVDWHWYRDSSLHWPTFNVADVGISVGVSLMLAETLLSPRVNEPEAAPEDVVTSPEVPSAREVPAPPPDEVTTPELPAARAAVQVFELPARRDLDEPTSPEVPSARPPPEHD